MPKRLNIEVNDRTSTDLDWLVQREALNRTTVINRAVQVYRMIVEAQDNGGWAGLSDDGGQMTRLHIL